MLPDNVVVNLRQRYLYYAVTLFAHVVKKRKRKKKEKRGYVHHFVKAEHLVFPPSIHSPSISSPLASS